MTRRADLWRFISLALVVRSVSFQPQVVPLVGKTVLRSAAARHRSACSCTADPGQECYHASVQHDDSALTKAWAEEDEDSDGKVGEGSRGEEGSELAGNPLVEYFARHKIESAEIFPVHLNASGLELVVEGGAPSAQKSVNVKTVIFQAKGKPFAAIMRRELVADSARMARHFRLPTRQITLAGPPFVEELTGFSVGTIPPLGHRTRLPTLVDAELLEYSTVIGGAGQRGFHSRLSVYDLVKATAASVIFLARPRLSNAIGADVASLTSDSASAAPALDSASSTMTSTGTKSQQVMGGSSASTLTNDCLGENVLLRRGAGSPPGENKSSPRAGGVGEVGCLGTASATGSSGDGRARMESEMEVGERARGFATVDPAGPGKIEARLRVVAAAMQAVVAALSAVSVLLEGLDGSGGGGKRDGDREDYDRAPSLEISHDQWSDVDAIGAILTSSGARRQDGAEEDPPTALGVSELGNDRRGGYLSATADGATVGMASMTTTRGSVDDFNLRGYWQGEQEQSEREISRAATEAAPVKGLGVVLNQTETESLSEVTAPGGSGDISSSSSSSGDAIWRAAGTPTLDAIGGDVHLVALVAGKRSLTRLLHFVDLVPPMDTPATAVASNQTCLVRKAWMRPGTPQDRPPRSVQVQLIMGKALIDRLGEENARTLMRGVKRGQLLYVTGRPTPDTRLRFFGDGGAQQKSVSRLSGNPNSGSTSGSTSSGTSYGDDVYDLVCFSVRTLEEAPAVEAELVGKGDAWDGGGEYLTIDLDVDEAVTYVDSSGGLREMAEFIRKALLDSPINIAGDNDPGGVRAGSRRAMAIDCEWRPGTRAGAPQNPVSLMQLAVEDRVFLVDMLHVCRSKGEAAAATAAAAVENDDPTGLTETEALLEDALGAVLRAKRVVKVGVGPKADFQSLMRSFPHLPCFRRVCGVVNLTEVARNAASLKKIPAEEKGSLSRLSKLVLGKPLDKSEQCSDWGTRPLSGRQKRYAALDARATLLVHQKLTPEVPAERMEALLSTFFYDERAHGIVAIQTLPHSYTPYASSATTPRAGRKRRRRAGFGRRENRGGGSGQDRKRMLLAGVSTVQVSEVRLDVEGLERDWLGRAIPGLTKEGVVRACMSPRGEKLSSASGEPPHVILRFDRHLSFVEFQNGYALLMNCLGDATREREHASGFLDEDGSVVAWYLQGRLAPEPTTTTTPTTRDSSSNAVGKFLQRLEASSSASPSIWGGLPDDGYDDNGTADLVATPPKDADRLGDEAVVEEDGGELPSSGTPSTPSPSVSELVLFARSKGRPFVYCGAVDCVAQEYVWNTGSSRLGAVRFTLALRDWQQASAAGEGREEAGGLQREAASGGTRRDESASFREIVREGLKAHSNPYRL